MQGGRLSRINLKALSIRPNLGFRSLYDRLFFLLLGVDVVLRLIWLDKPYGSTKFADGSVRDTSSLIFDEWYYVNVSRVILGLFQSVGGNGNPPYMNVPQGLDPNHEHPPLAKLLIALSMNFLGDNAYGWRIPSVVFGSLAVLFFYLLMKKTSKYEIVPLLATFLFSFESLIFIQSRIAILDIFVVTFMLLGFYWYFSGHPYLSAIGMALSTLSKITGAAGIVAIAAIHLIRFITTRTKTSWNEFFSWFEKYFLTYVVSFLVILTILDRFWVGYSNPLTHLQFILSYSTALVSACPNGIISCPWQWLISQVQIPYLIVNVQVTGGDVTRSYESVAFWGIANPAILYLTVPAMLYSAYSYHEKRDDFSLLALIWFGATYLPYLPAVILGERVTYLFYFITSVPAICASIAHMVAEQNPPKLVVAFYLAVVLVWFYLMFPFKVIPA